MFPEMVEIFSSGLDFSESVEIISVVLSFFHGIKSFFMGIESENYFQNVQFFLKWELRLRFCQEGAVEILQELRFHMGSA